MWVLGLVEDDIGNAIWPWSLVRFEEADCAFDATA
jgi:hypothetical protein